MKEKEILVISIIAILAIIVCITAFLMVNSNQENYETLRISNSCTVDVPNVNNTMERMDGGISKYIFDSVDLNITHQKSGNNTQLKSMNAELLKNSEKVEGDIYRESDSKVYLTFIENKNTGDALLITSLDLDLLKKVVNNIKFTKPLTSNSTANDTGSAGSNQTGNGVSELINKYNEVAGQQNNNQSSSNPETIPVQEESSNSQPTQESSEYPSFIPYKKIDIRKILGMSF